MNLINRDTDYAVRALRHLARQDGGAVSVAQMAPELNIPRPYLRRILQDLARHGILRSFRGRRGGFALNKPPEDIVLTDVIKLFQGEFDFAPCVVRGELCSNAPTCPLRRTIKDVEELAVERLEKTSLASLL